MDDRARKCGSLQTHGLHPRAAKSEDAKILNTTTYYMFDFPPFEMQGPGGSKQPTAC